MKQLLSLALIMAILEISRGQRPTLELIKAGQDLAYAPIRQQEQRRTDQAFEANAVDPVDLGVIRLRTKSEDVIDGIWETLSNPRRLTIIKDKGVEKEVLKMFRLMQSDIFALDSQISRSKVVQTLKTLSLASDTKQGTQWRASWDLFQTLTGKIGLYYSYLDGFMTAASGNSGSGQLTQIAIEDYAKSIIQPGSTGDTAISKTLEQLHKLITPPPPKFQQNATQSDDQGQAAFVRLHHLLVEKNGINLCNLGQSPHQLIYNLYNVIALTEIKGYAMIQFSYMMLKLYDKGNFTVESELARETFKNQASEKLMAVKNILPHMETLYWRCDAQTPNPGVTYLQLTELLQGHIENEVDMNDISSCRHNCAAYGVAEPKACYKNLLCAKQTRCTGRLYDCQFYHADSWVCMSSKANRRYDWIEYEDGRILGKKGQCVNKIKVDSWWRWVFYHCSYCLCKCDAPGPRSDRYWSLKEATANIKKNFLVTGVRFVKKGRVINMEIEQARALPEGSVDESSRVWLQAQEVRIRDDTIVDTKNSDYMTMSYEQRAIDLDKLKAPSGHVITGVKFRNLGGHLNLEARVTPIKFKEGTLLPDQSIWIGNDNTPATQDKRTQIRILDPDIPTKFSGHSSILSDTNQFVQFDTTSAKKDVMQTTIPFIDAQNVAPSTGTWLSGVGLYHKGSYGYGGYVGLSVSTFDFTKHLLPDNVANARQLSHQDLKYDFKNNVI